MNGRTYTNGRLTHEEFRGHPHDFELPMVDLAKPAPWEQVDAFDMREPGDDPWNGQANDQILMQD